MKADFCDGFGDCIGECPTGALKLVDLATMEPGNEIQFPAGFPKNEKVNPSTRFIMPKVPTMVRR